MFFERFKKLSPQNLLILVFIIFASLFLIGGLLASFFYRTMDVSSYLSFHMVVEIFSVIVCFSIFGVGYFTYNQSHNRYALFLSCAFLTIGVIGIMHLLSFPRMPSFITPNTTSKGFIFYIISQLILAISLIVSVYICSDTVKRWLSKKYLLPISLIIPVLIFVLVIYFPSYLPIMFIEGSGATTSKEVLEWIVIGLFACAFILYWRRFSKTGENFIKFILAAIIALIFCELSFTLYQSAFDTYNMAGHSYKVIAFILIYFGIFFETVTKPYNKLENEIKEREEAEEKYHRIIENVLDAYFQVNMKGRITMASPSAARMYGYGSPDEMIGMDVLSLYESPEKRERALKHLENDGKIENLEGKGLKKDGTLFWVLLNIQYVYDDQRSVVGTETFVRDISQRKHAEEVLKESELFYRAIFENTGTASIIFEKNNIISLANREFEKLSGYTRKEIEGQKKWMDFVAKEDIEKMKENHQKRLKNPQNVIKTYYFRLINRQGQLRNILLYIDIIPGTAKSIASLLDITVVKKTEKALKESEKNYRDLVDNSLVGIFKNNMDGEILFANKAMAEMFQFDSVYELKQVNIKDLYQNVEDRQPVIEILEKEGKISNFKTELVGKDGKSVNVIISASLSDGIISGMFMDITELHRAEEEVKESLNEKELLLREIHHRVKNNLQIISSLLELQKQYVKEDSTVAVLDESKNRVMSIAMIHEKLYQSHDLSHINFKDYLNSLLTNLFYSYGVRSHINLMLNLDEVYLNMETAVPLGIIIIEIISNSLKYAFPNDMAGEIAVNLTNINGKFELIISDNGVGIPEEVDLKAGTTLGLQLVDSLVNQIEGTIELDKAEGTKYSITFNELKYRKRF